MKRTVALLLALMCAALPLLAGCAVISSGGEYCRRFLNLIQAGEYAQAYDMISESVKKPDDPDATLIPEGTPDPNATEAPAEETEPPADTPAPDGTPDPNATPDANATEAPAPTEAPTPSPTPDADGNPYVDRTISRTEFINKYRSIFNELQLQGMEYEILDVQEGDTIAIVSYRLTYHTGHETDNGNDLIYDMEITASREGGRWVIDWSPLLIFPMMDWGDTVRVGVLQSKRGEILCDGVPYAQNVNVYTVYAVPSSVDAAAADETYLRYNSREEFAQIVASIPQLELKYEDVMKALNNQRNDFASLQTFYPDEVDETLTETILDIRGLGLDTANYGTVRYYPYGASLSHIVGYASIITRQEQTYYEMIGDTRYNGDSWVGKYGLELEYEDELTGTNGRFTYIQDVTGASNGVLYRTEAVDGKDLHLTIIPELQERLEDVIETTVYDDNIHGAVIVMNPTTGAIQAMTSFPNFDLNYVSRGMPEAEWDAYLAETDGMGQELNRLFNRATQGLYPPGSTFKLMTAAALIETGTLTPNSLFPSSEQARVDGDEWFPSEELAPGYVEASVNRPIRRTENTTRQAFPMNMINSLITSDNIYFAYGALLLGWDKLYDFLDRMGWREAIEFELQDQVAVPQIYSEMVYVDDDGNEVIEDRRRKLVLDENGNAQPQRPQTVYDLAVTGYGQGQLLVSPLQMACFASAYANGGDIMVPYVVDSIWHATGTDYTMVAKTEPRVWKHALQQSTVDQLHEALQRVCLSRGSGFPGGTARTLTSSFLVTGRTYDLGYSMAGKTGTAEIGKTKTEELAWFICWRDNVPDEEARLVCIMLELDLTDGKIPTTTEISQMKFDIARAVLRKDVLNEGLSLNVSEE